MPGVDPDNKPVLVDEKINDFLNSLPADESKILAIFRSLPEPERSYLLIQAQTYLKYQKSKKT